MPKSIKITCPLGHKCKTTDTEGNVIEQCAWLTTVQGTNPQTGADTNDELCAITWQPILQVQTAKFARSTVGVLETFRNEMVENNSKIIGPLLESYDFQSEQSRLK